MSLPVSLPYSFTNPPNFAIKSGPRQGVIALSNGSASPYEIPADVGQTFPTDASCRVDFKDTNGDLVAQEYGTVFADRCQWLFFGSDIDAILRGMNFEAFILANDGTPFKMRYGKVIRREATFEYASSAVQPVVPVSIGDNFSNRTGQPGKMYAQVLGNTRIHDNSGIGGIGATGNGLGVDIGGLYQVSAVRINRPMSTDDMELSATVVNPYGAATGKTVLGLCGNTGLTNGIGVQLNALTNRAQIVQVTGPHRSEVNALGSDVGDSPGNFDTYTIKYSDQTKIFSVYKNGSGTAMLSYHDTSGLITHGRGYRYPLYLFDASLVSTGPEITSWQAQDTV